MRSRKTIVCLVALACATITLAQFEKISGQPPKRESAEERATRKAQQLRDTLNLDCDQFNSVYKVYYNEYSAMEQQMMPQGGPPQGGGGMPPQGFGGGMPPQGFEGGGMPPMDFNGEMPTPPQPKELTEDQLRKQQEKRLKKIKKILTEQQYELWLQLDTIKPPMPPQH